MYIHSVSISFITYREQLKSTSRRIDASTAAATVKQNREQISEPPALKSSDMQIGGKDRGWTNLYCRQRPTRMYASSYVNDDASIGMHRGVDWSDISMTRRQIGAVISMPASLVLKSLPKTQELPSAEVTPVGD